MNLNYISQKIRPFVAAGKLTYDDFDKIFGMLKLKDQYQICYAIEDELKIELVDELDLPPEEIPVEEVPEEIAKVIVKKPYEIKAPNRLLCRMIQDGDEQARQDLCTKNAGLVGKYAAKYHKMFPDKLELDELMQEGFFGMLKAAEKFDCNMGTAFSTYAVLWIERYIKLAIANTGSAVRLPIHVVESIIKASRLDRNFEMQGVNNLRQRIELIAREMEADMARIIELFKLREIYFRLISLDVPVGEDLDTPLKNFIADEKDFLEEEIFPIFLREKLEDVLGTLTLREEKILRLRFGLDDGRTRTLEEVGKIFGLTRERIRQIEAKALRKLRHPARSQKLKDFLH